MREFFDISGRKKNLDIKTFEKEVKLSKTYHSKFMVNVKFSTNWKKLFDFCLIVQSNTMKICQPNGCISGELKTTEM